MPEDFSATASGSVMIVKVDGDIIPSDNDSFTSPFVDLLARVINAQDGDGVALTGADPKSVRFKRRQKRRATFLVASSNKAL